MFFADLVCSLVPDELQTNGSIFQMLNLEKLKSVAYLSLQGTDNERKIASKLLAKHGVTAHEILSDHEPINHDNGNRQPTDINELSQMFCDEMLGKLEDFSENLIDSLDSLRIIFCHFLK